jgi:hypothetical protein
MDITFDRPQRVSLITNPNSGRNLRGGLALRRLLRAYPKVCHREARDPIQVAAALEELAALQPDLLVVNGGDGTVQAVLTALFGQRPFASLPRLALLRGGTTNMNADDVGVKGSAMQALRRLLCLSESVGASAQVTRRPILRVEVSATEPARYGMFFGTGAIVKGIEYCHRKVHTKGFRDGIAPGLCTLRLLLALGRGSSPYVAPTPMKIMGESEGRSIQPPDQQQDYLLLLASSLERLFLGLRPYWGEERGGAFYFSCIRARPEHLWRALPGLFWGRPGPRATPETGYYSEKVNGLKLEMDGPVTLDGEIYHAAGGGGPVHVSLGGWASFLRR